MTPEEFENIVHQSTRPVIAYIWAPWCIPCRSMSPALQEIATQFTGQVELLKINADDSPDVVRSLGIMSIPTLAAFNGRKLIFRRMGAQSPDALREIFSAAVLARRPTLKITLLERLLRAGSGTVLLILSLSGTSRPNLFLLIAGSVFLFSAVYDRCPIYRALSSRLKEFLKHRHFRSMI